MQSSLLLSEIYLVFVPITKSYTAQGYNRSSKQEEQPRISKKFSPRSRSQWKLERTESPRNQYNFGAKPETEEQLEVTEPWNLEAEPEWNSGMVMEIERRDTIRNFSWGEEMWCFFCFLQILENFHFHFHLIIYIQCYYYYELWQHKYYLSVYV